MASNFSKEHYIQIGEVLRGSVKSPNINKSTVDRIIARFITMFSIDNQRFHSEKFHNAIYKQGKDNLWKD